MRVILPLTEDMNIAMVVIDSVTYLNGDRMRCLRLSGRSAKLQLPWDHSRGNEKRVILGCTIFWSGIPPSPNGPFRKFCGTVHPRERSSYRLATTFRYQPSGSEWKRSGRM